jgi:hypothetical protein
MKQKTAMTELIEKLSTMPNEDITNYLMQTSIEYLGKEKEQMENSFHIGIIVSTTGQRLTYNEYHRKTYLED